MSLEFRMPSLGADMEAGTLVEWMVKPGDVVKRGDIVAVVETEKGAIEVEIFESGVVDALLVGQGEKVPVGTVLARLRPPSERAAAPLAPEHAPTVPPARPTVEAPPAAPPEAAPGRLRASPLARRLAQELGVDLTRVQGTGPGGAITREDVEKAAAPTGTAGSCAAGAPQRSDCARNADSHVPPRRCSTRCHAPGDCRSNGPLEPRDPALLPANLDRYEAGA